MVTVSDVMKQPVVTVSMDETVQRLRELFERQRFHHLIVTEKGRIVGVISDRDLLKAISPFAGTPSERRMDESCLKRRAHQIMSRANESVGPDASIEEASRVMLEQNISCVPVVNGHSRCVGILTLRDVCRWAIETCLPRFEAATGGASGEDAEDAEREAA